MHPDDRATTTPSRRRCVRLGLAALALALVTIVAGAPLSASATQEEPPGGIGLRLLDAPVSTQDDPRTRVYIVDHLAPGTVIERRIEVANTTATAQAVDLYAAAASIEDGAFIGSPGGTLNDLASWTTVTPASANVPAGATEIALVTITVPDDAAPGESYGAVWAQAQSDPGEGGGVVQVSRVGIRLYVSVGPGGAPAADFTIQTLTAERAADGSPVVSATVQNTGGRALDMSGTLELTNGPGGLTAGPFPTEFGSTLGVGDTDVVRVLLDNRLPEGPWDAIITLKSGLIERTGEATITFAPAGAAVPVPVADDGGSWPWALAVVAATLLALLVVAGAWIRWHGGRRPHLAT